MKPIKETLPKIVDSGASYVSYDKDSILKSLTKEIRKPKTLLGKLFLFPYPVLLRFFILFTIIIAVITIVLTFSFTYFKDVLFFKSNLSVNRHGVFMPSKSCGREYCLFLFNASELWSNTGIYLNEGDRYKISVSGAFHSSVEDLRRNAELNNPDPDNNWIGGKQRNELSAYLDSIYSSIEYNKRNAFYRVFHRKAVMPKSLNEVFPEYEKHTFCVDTNAYFGAILYRIAPEYQLWDPDDPNDSIIVWRPQNGETYQEVKTSGVLSMAINDIYFKDSTKLREYCQSYPVRFDSDTIPYNSIIESDKKKGNFKTIFYDDNIGQILVCMEIQHPLYWGFFNPLSPFRQLDTAMELKAEKSHSRLQLFITVIPNFIIFFVYIFTLIAIYTGASIIIVLLAFLFGYWICRILRIGWILLHKIHVHISRKPKPVNSNEEN